jgi:hypothetical protein
MAGALIGALRVSLSAETTAFEAGMKRSQRTANRTASSIEGSFKRVGTGFTALRSGLAGFVGALSVGSIFAAGKAALDYASSLGELASTLGVTTRDLQMFSYAAGQVGISQEELQTGLQKLTISMGQAQLGAKKQVEAFNAIGISVDQLKGKDAGEVFRMIAERLERVEDRSQRAAVEVALFGKAGAKLDNLLSGSQGRLSELSDAAERLGIVLSDEQIQNADDTADKLEALQTVLKAKIAGVVADNARSISDLADALAMIVTWAGRAANMIGAVSNAIRNMPGPPEGLMGFLRALAPGAAGVIDLVNVASTKRGSSSVTVKLPPSRMPSKPLAVSDFLGGGGGGGRRGGGRSGADDAERKRQEELRKAYDFARDQNAADRDILQAKRDLAADYIEQTSISVMILDKEREAFELELQYAVASKDRTQAEADILRAKYDQKDALERQKLLDEEETQRAEDFAALDQADFDRKKEILERQSDLADTQAERRQIELDLLELAYAQKRQALQQILETSKDFKEIENARRDLENLNKTEPLDRAGVMKSTAGPLESYFNSIPRTAAQMNEALEALQVQGLDALVDALSRVGEGWEAMRDAALAAIQDIVAQLIRMQLQKMLFSLIGSAAGGGAIVPGTNSALGLPQFAHGGSMILGGRRGIDKNVLSLNGMPIAKVSYGERASFSNDNKGGGMTPPAFVFNNYARMSSDEARRTGAQAAAGWTAEMNRARSKGIG